MPKAAVPKMPEVAEHRRERSEAAIEQFEARRDLAEYQAALGCWQRDDSAGCEALLRGLLKRNPEHLPARLLTAELRLYADRPQEALEELDVAARAHPGDPRVQHAMGLALDALSQRAEALARYRRAMEMAPDEEVYAVSYHAALDGGEAVASDLVAPDSSVVAGLPTEPRVRPKVSNAAAETSGRPPTAGSGDPRRTSELDALGEAMATDLDAPTASDDREDREGRVDSAEREAGETAGELFRLGAEALAGGSPDAALAYYREALRRDADPASTAVAAAVESLRRNYPDVAVELLEPLGERFADSTQVWRTLGTAYYRLGDYRASQVALQQALSLDKSSALTYFLMGCTLAKLGQTEPAAAHWRQARSLDPRYAAVR